MPSKCRLASVPRIQTKPRSPVSTRPTASRMVGTCGDADRLIFVLFFLGMTAERMVNSVDHEQGIIMIHSFSDTATLYTIRMAIEAAEMEGCSCPDFERTFLVCKHMHLAHRVTDIALPTRNRAPPVFGGPGFDALPLAIDHQVAHRPSTSVAAPPASTTPTATGPFSLTSDHPPPQHAPEPQHPRHDVEEVVRE